MCKKNKPMNTSVLFSGIQWANVKLTAYYTCTCFPVNIFYLCAKFSKYTLDKHITFTDRNILCLCLDVIEPSFLRGTMIYSILFHLF